MASHAVYRHDVQSTTIPAGVLLLGICFTKVTPVLNYSGHNHSHSDLPSMPVCGYLGSAMHWAGPRERVTLPQIRTKTMSCPEMWDLFLNQDFKPFLVSSAVYIQHMQSGLQWFVSTQQHGSANHILLRSLFQIQIPECPAPDSSGSNAFPWLSKFYPNLWLVGRCVVCPS